MVHVEETPDLTSMHSQQTRPCLSSIPHNQSFSHTTVDEMLSHDFECQASVKGNLVLNEDQLDTGQKDRFNIHASTENVAELAMDQALYNFIGGQFTR